MAYREATDVVNDVAKLFTPPPRLTISQWADQYRYLSPESSPEPGKYHTSRVEFARGMMDAVKTNEITVFMTSAQVTKALDVQTPIPTIEGWTTIGNIQIGDIIFSETGEPCTVTHKSQVFKDRQCYKVIFSDGAELVADADHLWGIHESIWGAPKGYTVKSTIDIFRSIKNSGNTRKYAYFVKQPYSIKTPSKSLPLDPYLLGVYLGDGTRRDGRITCHKDDFAHYQKVFTKKGYKLYSSPCRNTETFRVEIEPQDKRRCIRGHVLAEVGLTRGKYPGYCAECKRQQAMNYKHGHPQDRIVNKSISISEKLKELDLLNANKFIPILYLRASRQQRIELLQGLMDTDGMVHKNGVMVFNSSEHSLIEGVSELLASLGVKHKISDEVPIYTYKGEKKKGKLTEKITFYIATDEFKAFKLKRKLSRVRASSPRIGQVKQKKIVSIEPAETRSMQCIAVDSPSRLFLAGERFTPTHNTTIVENMIGYYIHLDPAPMLLINPTLDMSETFSKDRFDPMIRDCPCFKGLVAEKRSRDKNSTILHKVFKGGMLAMAGANSPSSLASRPIRILLGDEIDRFAASAGKEGDPLSLSIKRTTRFWNRRILLASTPTTKGMSRIEKEWNKSDKRRYYVPCPFCQTMQTLKFESIVFSNDANLSKEERANTAVYICPHCEGQIETRHKPSMIQNGQWRPTAKGRIAGFHIWEGYFPTTPWSKIILEFLESKDDPLLLQVFVNTVLGELWEEAEEQALEWEKLLARAEPYQPLTCPMDCLLLTAGVDVQGDRIECSVWGWGKNQEAWLIYHAVFWGDPTGDMVWDDLDIFLQNRFDHESGATLPISTVGIDSGYLADHVYNFVRRRPGRRIRPVKGMSNTGKPAIGKPSSQEVNWKGRTLKQPIRVWPVGTDVVKTLIHARLKAPKGVRGYIHFPVGIEPEYYEQLCAEKRVRKIIKTTQQEKWVWIKSRKRNEALDCFVYAYAVAIAYGLDRINWEDRKKMLTQHLKEKSSESTKTEDVKTTISPQGKASRKRKRKLRSNFFS